MNAPARPPDDLLRTIAAGTAADVGEEFFRSLVRNLAAALGVRYAFVAEFTAVRTRVRTLAFWAHDQFLDNIEFDLAGTPCEAVVCGEVRHYPQGIQQLFPADEGLVTMEAESYLAVPLIDAGGEVLGHLAALDTRVMDGGARELSLFQIFGARAAAELVRLRSDRLLRDREDRLRQVLASATDAVIALDGRGAVALFNPAACKAFGCTAEQAMGGPFERFATPELAGVVAAFRGEPGAVALPDSVWLPDGIAAVRANGERFPVEGTLARTGTGAMVTLFLRDVDERRRMEAELRRLQGLTTYLQEQLGGAVASEAIGASPAFRRAMAQVAQVAATDSTVLITGETGTGKEVLARALHARSTRRARAMIVVNCAALPAGTIESELFGHEKGAFTGALSRKPGRFELADGGTLFLDEIGELPLELQGRLLRVLQEGEFERLGSTRTQHVDVRVVAATHRDLAVAARAGSFRADLFYRLNVFPIHAAPLRERREDIPPLAFHFVRKFATRMGKQVETVPVAAMEALQRYDWPGNVRELANVVERAVILTRGPELELGDWAPPGS